MGCYAAFPALRQAQTICQADPEAVVLVVSVELCTLHVRTSNDPDTIVGSSLFADGAAAAVVTGRDLPASTPLLQLDHFETVLTPVGEDAMAWSIGDNGFEMVLGTYVPHIIDEHIVGDRKSTRLNSSHVAISYAVFCLKKKNKKTGFLERDYN